MRPSAALIAFCILSAKAPGLLASGTSAPPPVFGNANSDAFEYESTKGTVVGVDAAKGILVLRENKKKNPREITLKLDTKTSLKAGKEKLQIHQLVPGSLVKVVYDRANKAVAVKVEK